MAKFDYQPTRDDELALQKGQMVKVLEKSSDGWWKGEIGMERGWFPSNYVENCQTTPAEVPYVADYGTDYNGGFHAASVLSGADSRNGIAQLGNGLRGYPSSLPSSISPNSLSTPKVHEVSA